MADLREIAAGASEACVPLILDAMGEISGRVLDSQGNPVEGAVISAGFSGDREAFEVTRHVESGPDGRFRLGGLPFWKGGWVIARKGRKGVWWAGFSDVPVGVHDLEIRVLGHSKGKLTPYGKR